MASHLISCVLLCMGMLFNGKAIAQQFSIEGRVMTENGPAAFAEISIINGGRGAVADQQGFFKIVGLNAGIYQLEVSLLGYERLQKTVQLDSANAQALQLLLNSWAGQLGEVVITGQMKEVSRLESPVPVEVYKKEFFRANPVSGVFEAVQHMNGLRPQINCNVCNTGDIHINGLEGPYTMVLIDGMPIVSGLATVYGLMGIPSSLIERVEVVKGPAATLYGSEAVAGLINVITKSAQNAPLASAEMFGTAWGELNADMGLRYKTGKNSSGLLGLNYFNYTRPLDRNGDGITDLSLQHRISLFNKWNLQANGRKLFSIAGRYLYEDRWGGQMNWTPAFRGGDSIYGESIYTSRWELFGEWYLPGSEPLRLQFSCNGHQQNSVYGNMHYHASQYIGFAQLLWNRQFGKHDLLSGASFRYNWYDDNTPATISFDQSENQPSIVQLPGVFIQDEFKWNRQSSLLAGLRLDFNNLHGWVWSPRLNYKWKSLNRKHTLRLSAGNGYRLANVFTEDHAALTGARQVVFEEQLAPERSWNGNLNYVRSYLLKRGYLNLDLLAFYSHFSNRILPDYDTDPNKIIYANLVGLAVSKGISLTAEAAFDFGLKLNTGATFMDVQLRENGISMRPVLTESVQGVWTISYAWPKRGWEIDYTGVLYGPMRLPLLGPLDNRPEYSPWFSIQNIQCTKEFNDRLEMYFGIKNLLNFTPPANSIARAFDPFDRQVQFDANGQVIPTPDNPNALSFDPSYVYASNQGIRAFLGLRWVLP